MAVAICSQFFLTAGGSLSSPLLIVALILKEHLLPENSPQLPVN
jgi:hypothetical protein